jgi:hypothetical protein
MLLTVNTPADLDIAMERVMGAARSAAQWFRTDNLDPLALLFRAKFTLVGFDPFDLEPLNLVEQINQTWSLVTALQAARLLLERHPEAGGFTLAPGAHAAQPLDIMSVVPELVGAEIFAAVTPGNNRKLSKDLTRLRNRPERYRYIFFMSPPYPRTERLPQLERDGVEVWSVAAPEGCSP